MNPSVVRLLHQVRRRLRAAFALAWLQVLAPVLAGTALALVVAGRLLPWAWAETAAVAVAAAGVAAVVVAALVVRVPLPAVARAADRGLATHDAFSTALEVEPSEGFGARIHERAGVLARTGRARDAVPYRLAGGRLAFSTVLAVAAVGLAVVANPQDEARARRAAERAAVAREAERLETEAEALAEEPGGAGAAEALQQLAEALARTEDLDEARELASATSAELSTQVSPDLLAQKAAVQGLERSLAGEPLSGDPGAGAASQLADLAAQLGGLDPDTLAALAERLGGLAEAQEVGSPDTAAALAAAAEALAGGDAAGAADALAAAAAAQQAAAGGVAAQQAAQAGAGQAAAAGERLASAAASGQGQAAQGSTQGQGEGQGQGQGQGSGQTQGSGSGQGQGSGSGSGSGQGQGSGGQGSGSGAGGGSPSGTVAGGSGSTGSSGQGGVGTPGGVSSDRAGSPSAEGSGTVPGGGTGPQVVVGGGTGQPGDVVGTGDGPTATGTRRVPLGEVLADYEQQATEALTRGGVPPSVQALVRAYFDALAGRAA